MDSMNIEDHCIIWIETVQKAEDDPELAAAIVERCRKDRNYFFNNWLWTFDPRREVFKILPFKLWDFQKEYLDELDYCYKNQEPLLVEKTRDMGFSWLTLGWFLHKMIFEKGFSCGVGSQKFSKVDTLDDMDSLLEKVRFMLRRLPPFLRGDWNDKIHTKTGLIVIPETNSTMTGEGGDNIGRGGRKSAYLLDEFAHVQRSSIVQEAISQNCGMRIYGSTPKGKGNEFARLRWKSPIRRFSMHWKRHPNKDRIWYEKQKETMTPEMIAQELDISYSKSVKGKVYKWFNSEIHASKRVKYNPNHDIYLTFDWGINDPTACLFLQDYGGKIRIFDFFEESDTEISRIFTNEVIPRLSKLRRGNRNLHISDVAGWYGDPDGRNRNLVTGTSVANWVEKNYHIKLRFHLPNHIGPRILSTRKMGTDGRIEVDSDLTHVVDCLENYRYPEKDHGENEKPLHDWTSHLCSSLEYYCVFEHPVVFEEPSSTVITTTRFR